MLGNLHVRFGGGDPETYRGNVARRRVSTLRAPVKALDEYADCDVICRINRLPGVRNDIGDNSMCVKRIGSEVRYEPDTQGLGSIWSKLDCLKPNLLG